MMTSSAETNTASPRAQVKDYVERAEKFLRGVLPLSRLALDLEVKPGNRDEQDLETPDWVIHFVGQDEDLLLENHGELLAALEYLALKVARVPAELTEKIGFDCKDWRFLRVQELKLSAEAAAERVRATGDPFEFNPMTARERRILHMALRDDASVRTAGEGMRHERKVVIYPAS